MSGKRVIELRDVAIYHAENPFGRQSAERLVRSGELGEIHAVNFTGQHPLNYGTRPLWYFDRRLHGGTFNDLAIHGLDAVSMITGLSYARTLCARQYNAFAREEPSFPDCAQLMGEYENGAGLIADVSYSAPAPTMMSAGCATSLPCTCCTRAAWRT